jgi:hypothetical protein
VNSAGVGVVLRASSRERIYSNDLEVLAPCPKPAAGGARPAARRGWLAAAHSSSLQALRLRAAVAEFLAKTLKFKVDAVALGRQQTAHLHVEDREGLRLVQANQVAES